MNSQEAYSFLFSDSLISSLVFIPQAPYIADTMKILGGYNTLWVMIISSVAMIIANIINYFAGIVLYNIFYRMKPSESKIDLLARIFNKWLFFLVLFVYVSILGPFIALFAGYGRMNFLKFLFLMLISIIGYNYFTLYATL